MRSAYHVMTVAELDVYLKNKKFAKKVAGIDEEEKEGEDPMLIVTKDMKASSKGQVWYFASLLESKAQAEIVRAVDVVVADLTVMFKGQAVFRIHGDRATELPGPSVTTNIAAKTYEEAREEMIQTRSKGKQPQTGTKKLGGDPSLAVAEAAARL